MSSPSGSGVVPDKPALALCHAVTGFEPHYFIPGRCVDDAENSPGDPRWCNVCGEPKCGPPVVPAVTDDEAATKVRAVALALAAVDGYDTYARQANEFITRLRSAGFLIVHHTKET